MNKERRKKINEIIESLNDLTNDLQELCDEETFALNCTPENLQNSENYQTSEEAASALEDSVSNIEAIVEDLECIC
jgi:division protein CdvB (Snf7/Vps24/ESCRT-III family)